MQCIFTCTVILTGDDATPRQFQPVKGPQTLALDPSNVHFSWFRIYFRVLQLQQTIAVQRAFTPESKSSYWYRFGIRGR